jgi:hypothetical protein
LQRKILLIRGEKKMPDGYFVVRHPAFMRIVEQARLRSCAEKAALFP